MTVGHTVIIPDGGTGTGTCEEIGFSDFSTTHFQCLTLLITGPKSISSHVPDTSFPDILSAIRLVKSMNTVFGTILLAWVPPFTHSGATYRARVRKAFRFKPQVEKLMRAGNSADDWNGGRAAGAGPHTSSHRLSAV